MSLLEGQDYRHHFSTHFFFSHKETVQDPEGELFKFFDKRFHPDGVKGDYWRVV